MRERYCRLCKGEGLWHDYCEWVYLDGHPSLVEAKETERLIMRSLIGILDLKNPYWESYVRACALTDKLTESK